MAGRSADRVGQGGAKAAAIALVLGAVVLGCSGAPGGPVAQSPDPSGLQAVVVSTATWVGAATVLVALEEADGAPVDTAGLTVSGRFVGPAGEAPSGEGASGAVEGRIVRPPGGYRDLVRFDVSLPTAGRWDVAIAVRGSTAAAERRAAASVVVRQAGDVPMRGEAAPATSTPTRADVGGDLARLTSDVHPIPAFYERSVADVLAEGVPFAFVLDTTGFLETPACGGAMTIFHRVSTVVPGVAVIHAEPFATRQTGAALTLDPPMGPARLASWSLEWGLDDPAFGPASVPWVFVVDRRGVVQAVFQGVMGSEEVAIALADVAG